MHRPIGYDLANRLVLKTYPDTSTVSFSYTATGRQATMADGRGTTSYGYDSRDRLLEMVYPDSRKLSYGWDPNGNRTSITAHVAGEVMATTSTYDALNRLDAVTDPRGMVYDHGYDANGNERAWIGAKIATKMIEIRAHDRARDLLRDAGRNLSSCGWLESISVLIAVSSAYGAMNDIDEARAALATADERLRRGLRSPSNPQEEADAQRLSARVGQAWAVIGHASQGRDLLSCVAHPAIRERALCQIDGIERARGLAALELLEPQ